MIFQVKKKSDFVAACLAKSAESWKKKEEIEALQEEIKRDKEGGGMPHVHVVACIQVCVCVSEKDLDERMCVCACARTSACITMKRKFQTKLQPQQAIPVILEGISSKHNAKENSTWESG